jgi:hypothetical protein
VFPSKYRVHIFLLAIARGIIFYPMYSRKPDQQRVEASTIAATNFFELVDAGKYGQSWESCAVYLKNEISKEDWITKLSAVRSVVGKLIDRKQTKYTYSKNTDEGIPEGEYMVYYFDSTFQNKKNLPETLTMMLENDNTWRVAGYFFK